MLTHKQTQKDIYYKSEQNTVITLRKIEMCFTFFFRLVKTVAGPSCIKHYSYSVTLMFYPVIITHTHTHTHTLILMTIMIQ